MDPAPILMAHLLLTQAYPFGHPPLPLHPSCLFFASLRVLPRSGTLEMAKAWKRGQRNFYLSNIKSTLGPHLGALLLASLLRRVVPKSVLLSPPSPNRPAASTLMTIANADKPKYIGDFKRVTTADRLSCDRFEVNEFSLLLHAFAFSSSGNYANSPRHLIRHSAKSPFLHCAPRCSRSRLVFAHPRGVSISNFPVTARIKPYLAASLQH
jgi:hypothetical protein